MKTVAFHLQKGGVGKTTLSGTMAYEVSKKGKTILIDCDPQGSASSWYLEDYDYELANVLYKKISVEDAICNAASNLDILPTFGLEGGLKLYGETKLNDEPFAFCKLFDKLEALGYEYVIADLSPGIGRLEKAILYACHSVITPMTPEHFSLDGLEIFESELKRLKEDMDRSPEHRIVVLNAFDARIGQHCEVAESAMRLDYKFVVIPVDPVFRKSQAAHISPQEYGGMKSQTEKAIKIIGELLWQ